MINILFLMDIAISKKNTVNGDKFIEDVIYDIITQLSLHPNEYYSVILQNSENPILKDIAYELDKAIGLLKKGTTLHFQDKKFKLKNFPYVPLILTVSNGDTTDSLENLVNEWRKNITNVLLVVIDENKRLDAKEGHYILNVDSLLNYA